MQWVVAFGCIAAIAATVTMAGFRLFPYQGHLKCLKRIYCFLCNYKKTAIWKRFQIICRSPEKRRSCTGIVHLLNKTPIDWFFKRQNTVETVTYGSEFVAARTAVDQI
eukprot:4523757-Ditylum_brightwellii.AAC.1